MRISRQMRRILTVLSKSKKPLKTTEIILRCKGFKKPPQPYIQLELVSALAGESVSWFMGRNPLTGKDLEPYHKEARKLYVSFGRSLNALVKNELVIGESGSGAYGRLRQWEYRITEKGHSYLTNIS